jgi:long-chain acyl-CoA synthetase
MSYESVLQVLKDYSGLLIGTAVAAVTVQAAAWASTYTSDKPIHFPVSLDNQSVEIEPGVRASKFAADGKLIKYYHTDAKTTHEALVRGLRVSNNGPCIGTRRPKSKEYDWISYQEIYDRAQWLGSSFIKHGLKTVDSTCVGVYSPNCPEWVISEEACAMYSMAVVPLYDTLGSEACEYIINQTEMELVVCDTGPKADMLIQAAARMASLKTLVVIQANSLTEDVIKAGKEANIDVLTFSDMMEIGRNCLHVPVKPKPETICTICYTSGTTGSPKGVVVSHEAMIANVAAAIHHVSSIFTLTHEDVHMAYLPLAHMFERLNQLILLQYGARIGFNSGDIRLLLEDLAILKPTIFPTVPRLLNRIYDKVQQSLAGNRIKSALFHLAVNRKMVLLKRGIVTKRSVWDKLVFHRIQELLGGRVRACVVASAPLSEDILNFTRCAFGCYVFEGYGQTEITAAATMTLPHEWRAGIVGPPMVCAQIKLVDIPEMDYFAKENKGEICVRSSCVMSGYYKDPERTKEALDEDGWVHTGDVGQWLPNGVLKIIDRKKHIFKLAQGEYIAPEKIESIYGRSRFVAQIFVDGDSFQTFPVGIVVPDVEVVQEWAKKELNISCTLHELCCNQLVKKAIIDDITKLGKEAKLKGFEQVKDIHLCSDMFTVENGLLTPTLKSKRPALRRHFAAEIKNMYSTCL